MTLQIFVPEAPLAEYVHMFWAWEGFNPPHPKERILPHGTLEITINLTAQPFRLYRTEDGTEPQVIHGPMAAGAQSRFFIIDTAQPMSLLAVWFKPGGAVPFFGATGHELLNTHLPLEALWGAQARDLFEQLLAANTPAERFRILEQVLLRRLAHAQRRHRALCYALQAFRTVPHMPTIKQVVQALALSSTRFIQLFREDIGLTPKQFCRVQRYQGALRIMAAQPTRCWTDIALACGFYDQAHFINDFRAFSGITPSQYVPQSSEHYTNLAVFDEPD